MQKPQWQRDGHDPDYRFSLANERTFLAWIRTSLAVLAGAVLLHQFTTHIQPRLLLNTLACALAVIAAALAVGAYFRWKTNEIAMRNDRPLTPGLTIPLLAAGVACAAIALGILLLVQ